MTLSPILYSLSCSLSYVAPCIKPTDCMAIIKCSEAVSILVSVHYIACTATLERINVCLHGWWDCEMTVCVHACVCAWWMGCLDIAGTCKPSLCIQSYVHSSWSYVLFCNCSGDAHIANHNCVAAVCICRWPPEKHNYEPRLTVRLVSQTMEPLARMYCSNWKWACIAGKVSAWRAKTSYEYIALNKLEHTETPIIAALKFIQSIAIGICVLDILVDASSCGVYFAVRKVKLI